MKLLTLFLLFFSFVAQNVHAGRFDPEQTAPAAGSHPVIEENNRTFIVDRAGERWNITTAVKEYGMDPKLFHFGLGREAFTPIQNPKVLSAPPSGDPMIFGVVHKGEARAYDRASLTRHETAIDKLAGDRVLVAHCYLADLAGVYESTVDGKSLTLVASGWTYHNGHHDTFVLYDKETNSLWFPFAKDDFFVAIAGPLKGKKLKEIASMKRTTFSKWKKNHPKTGYIL